MKMMAELRCLRYGNATPEHLHGAACSPNLSREAPNPPSFKWNRHTNKNKWNLVRFQATKAHRIASKNSLGTKS